MKRLVTIQINGLAVTAPEGSTLAAVLIEHGYLCLRHSDKTQAPRAVFCGMGVCFECLVQVGEEELRACQTIVTAGMQVTVLGGQNG